MKKCAKCHIQKIDIEYSKTMFVRKSGWCKQCIKVYDHKHNANKLKSINVIDYVLKNCPKCNFIKNEFFFAKTNFQSKSGWCKDCVSFYDKAYAKNNLEKRKSNRKKYYLNNFNKKKNYDKIYIKYRRNTDPCFKLRSNVSRTINRYIKRNGSVKNKQSIKMFLAYSIEELKQHLESQFEPWMNWQKWGKYTLCTWNDNDKSTWTWHIDHIIPQSKLPYISMEDENFKKCWALNNLRPLSAKQNVSDQQRAKL